MGFVSVFLVICVVSLGSSSATLRQLDSNNLNVLNFGAVGDGIHDDSKAFLDSWTAACQTDTNSVTLTIPEHRAYLLQPINFEGPCKSPTINLQVSGNLVAPHMNAWPVGKSDNWILIQNVDGLLINGGGTLHGTGSDWWSKYREEPIDRPTMLSIDNCNNIVLQHVSLINSPRNHISIVSCKGVTLNHLQIVAPEDSPNTDGIDISHSTVIKVTSSSIATGDDCIAINGGTANVNIQGVACGPGHGISIGSLGRNGAYDTVEDVNVTYSSFSGTTNGARIKTWQGGNGYARQIQYRHITLNNANNPIIIDQFYCDKSSSAPCQKQGGAVKISDVIFEDIHGTTATDDAIQLSCSTTYGCTGIVLNKINITPVKPSEPLYSSCTNAHGITTQTHPVVNCL